MVVAILGILAAVAIVSYSGYVEGAKKKSVENVLQQISLGQTGFIQIMVIIIKIPHQIVVLHPLQHQRRLKQIF